MVAGIEEEGEAGLTAEGGGGQAGGFWGGMERIGVDSGAGAEELDACEEEEERAEGVEGKQREKREGVRGDSREGGMHGEGREREEGIRGRNREGVEGVRGEESEEEVGGVWEKESEEEVGGVWGEKTEKVERVGDRVEEQEVLGKKPPAVAAQLNRKKQENHDIDIGYKC